MRLCLFSHVLTAIGTRQNSIVGPANAVLGARRKAQSRAGVRLHRPHTRTTASMASWGNDFQAGRICETLSKGPPRSACFETRFCTAEGMHVFCSGASTKNRLDLRQLLLIAVPAREFEQTHLIGILNDDLRVRSHSSRLKCTIRSRKLQCYAYRPARLSVQCLQQGCLQHVAMGHGECMLHRSQRCAGMSGLDCGVRY